MYAYVSRYACPYKKKRKNERKQTKKKIDNEKKESVLNLPYKKYFLQTGFSVSNTDRVARFPILFHTKLCLEEHILRYKKRPF